MASNHDRHVLDLMIKHSKMMEYALEECIRQFDYSNNKKWRVDFKEDMIKIAREKMNREEGGS